MQLPPTFCVEPTFLEHLFMPIVSQSLDDEQLVAVQALPAVMVPSSDEEWTYSSLVGADSPPELSDPWRTKLCDTLVQGAASASNVGGTPSQSGDGSSRTPKDEADLMDETSLSEAGLDTASLCNDSPFDGRLFDEFYRSLLDCSDNGIDWHSASSIWDGADGLTRSSCDSAIQQDDHISEVDDNTIAVLEQCSDDNDWVFDCKDSPTIGVTQSRRAEDAQQDNEFSRSHESLEDGLGLSPGDIDARQADDEYARKQNSAVALKQYSCAVGGSDNCHGAGAASDIANGHPTTTSARAMTGLKEDLQRSICYSTKHELESQSVKRVVGSGRRRFSSPRPQSQSKRKHRSQTSEEGPEKRQALNDVYIRLEKIRLPASYLMIEDEVEMEGKMAVFRWTRRPEGWLSGDMRQHIELPLSEKNYKEAILEIRPNGGDLPVKLSWDMDSQNFEGTTLDNKVISIPDKWLEIRNMQLNPDKGPFLGRRYRRVKRR